VKPGDLVEVFFSAMGSTGAFTFAQPKDQRWFPNGTAGVILELAFPKMYANMYNVLIEGGVHCIQMNYLRVIDEAR
jgi:hypothetical protein